MKLSKTEIDKLPPVPKGKQIDYWDDDLKGFGLRVSSTKKVFFVMARVNGVKKRVTIGTYGVITIEKNGKTQTATVDDIRKKAMGDLSDLHRGVDINKEKAKARVRGITLEDAVKMYLEDRNLKASTEEFYRLMVKTHLKAWEKKPIKEITEDMVKTRHKQLSKTAGKVTANNVMKTFRAIYNHIRTEAKGDLPENPVKILSAQNTWHEVKPRKTLIKPTQLDLWYRAVRKLDNPCIRDFFLFTLFNGLRKEEALSLRWRDVDFKDRTFTIRDPKNHNDHTLPFSTFTESLLLERQKWRENDFVFPGTGKSGHLKEPRKQIIAIENETRKVLNGIADDAELEKRIKDNPDSLIPGIRFMCHDLRRSFANIAEEIASYAVLKRFLNHTPQKDVTSDYLAISIEKLRQPMQQIADSMMISMQAWSDYTPAVPTSSKVIDFDARRGRKAA